MSRQGGWAGMPGEKEECSESWGTLRYLGEFCWNITVTENESGPKPPETTLVRMGVTNVAGIYYTLQGIASWPDGPAVVDGTGILSGSQVLMTLAMSQDQSGIKQRRDAGILSMTLSTSGLGGTAWGIGTRFDLVARTFMSKYFAGTVAFTACP